MYYFLAASISTISFNARQYTMPRDYRSWDKKSIVPGGSAWTESCDYFKANTTTLEWYMCLRTQNDYISHYIKKTGRWDECDPLLTLIEQPPVKNNQTRLYVDVGSNIGSCLIMMLAAGYKSIGFEPSRHNFFYLTAGVMANPPEFRERITLYNIGLGDKHTTLKAQMTKENFGDTFLGDNVVKDSDTQQFITEADILVATLDDVLWPDKHTAPPEITLLKIDACGYEGKILRGAQRLLAAGAISVIKMEISPDWLRTANSSVGEVFSELKRYNYSFNEQLYNVAGWDIVATKNCSQRNCD
eukprot:TRINITY_DN2791_c0_g1_i2.p1 TRINITY_DN2791_c0_g1~~TRINITY_DN2791_c0_g1_i2.p1  ORF type:complete len:324 (-),score=32.36 TRINITY_DN2791_c0_g1_i2:73-975(-)